MVTDSTSQTDNTTAFLRAARSGNLEKVIEYLDTDLDINTANSNDLNALHLASKDGHVEIVTELLKRGAKVDAATKKGNTALHIASLAGQSETANILIQYGAQVNIQSQNGFTPLYMAAQENHDNVVKILLNNGANQSLATEDGFTPLAVAMQQGHDKVVSVLLENDSKGKVRLPALHIAAKKDDCKAADLLLQNDHKPDVTSKSGFTPLHIAAHYGNEEIAKLLIKRGADVNYQAKFNISPLHVAAKWGKNNMVKVLLENGAVIEAKTKDGLTPLHCAARSGHEEVVSTLLENSAPISARSKNGLAPLHMASQGDHVDAARVLLYHRAPVDEVTIDYLTSLHVAAHCGHVRVAKLLLDRKADPNARALNGFTPLHIACKKNRIKVVELLVKHGGSIESTTESGLTPLHVASFMGCMNIVIFLLQHEANPDVPTVRGETPLHLAARAKQTDIIRILLRNGAKVDARAREQQTPLHIASRLGNLDIVMLLLQHGADVDTTTKDMYTALHIAAKEGQDEVAAILLENKASIKAVTKNGFTPLHIAAKYGNMNVSKIFLQKDSKLDAQGKNNITPLHLACHYDHPNVVQLLLEKGASPNLTSQNGHTPLHIAARKNQMDTATILLEHGAKTNVESKAGYTALHLSAQKGHYDMINLLIDHGADPNYNAKNGLTALHLCAQEDFTRVASILIKNGANIEKQTQTGYRPIHIAAHFGNLAMIRFLLKHSAEIDVKTNQNYTPLHQAAQQGHAHVVSALIEGHASHRAHTNDGLTALNIAQKLGYISVIEVLKGLSYDGVTPDNKNWEEKYKVIAPESLQETSFISDSDEEGGSDALISEQPYRYLTVDLMKSLRDDSLPIDVTRDDPIHRHVSKEEKQQFVQSNNYCIGENFDNDNFGFGKLHFRSFLVSFLVDARGDTMKGCRHSGIRIIVPPRRATMPIRVTCRLVKPNKVINPPPLMEGESLAARIIEMGPVGASFLGPVLIDIPNFAAIRENNREIIILRSENGENWKEHDNSLDSDDNLLNTSYDTQMSALHSGRITRILTKTLPQYFAIVTRIKQEVHVIGAEGGILISSVANHVQAVFPPGSLTKKIIVGLQAHVIPTELTAKLLGNSVAVSPVVTIEPRRRKFHKPITLTIPVPQAANKGMINQYGGETTSLRLLCSIAGGTSEAQWEDVTGSTPLTFMNDRVSFTTTVSARFWLMDYRSTSDVPRMATELYKESLFVPFITNFVIYSKRFDLVEATLRILCMTDGKDGMHSLEIQENFLELVKSRDVEALDGKYLYIEFSGNLVPVTKSGVQLKFIFKSFRQNRISFHVKVKDPTLDPVARMLFMREPKVAKGEPPQQPVCVLNIVLPEIYNDSVLKSKRLVVEDSNKMAQNSDIMNPKSLSDHKEKCDEPKSTSPLEKKVLNDKLQKKLTETATFQDSFAKKTAYPLESVDASYLNKMNDEEDDLILEKQTYSEKRKFWEDITKKRNSYQRSESEISKSSQLTFNESDSENIPNVASEEYTPAFSGRSSETLEDMNIPDISECSVAEKAHYFEEQIQKEISNVKILHKSQECLKEKEKNIIASKIDTDAEEKQFQSSDKKEEMKDYEKFKDKGSTSSNLEMESTSQSLTKMESTNEKSLHKKLKESSKRDKLEALEKEVNVIKPDNVFLPDSKSDSKIPIKVIAHDSFKGKLDFEKKEDDKEKFNIKTTNKNMFQEKVEKESFSIPETSEVQKIERDVKEACQKQVVQKKEEFVPLMETVTMQKSKNKIEIKKEFKSNIPVAMSKTEKDKSIVHKQNKMENILDASSEYSLNPSISNPIAGDAVKKTELESRIPIKLQENKELKPKEEHHRIEKVVREEVTSTKKKSETHIFSKTFTAQPQDAIKMFEDLNTLKDESDVVVTSIIDQEASTTQEKIETMSSEILKGNNKFLLEEKKEDHKSKMTSEKCLKKQFPEKLVQESQENIKELNKTTLQNTSIMLTSDKEIVDTSASQAVVQSEASQKSIILEDKQRIIKEVEDFTKMKKSKIDVGMKIETDLLNLKESISDVTADEYFHKEESKSFDAKNISKEESHPPYDQAMTKLEATNIAETLVKSIEKELKNRSISSDGLKKELEDSEHVDSEDSDNQLADDLTKKFHDITEKSILQENIESGSSIQEEIFEKDYTQDSVSVSEDLARDDESFLQDKEGLSSSRFHVTLSSSSISDHIDLEDVEGFVLEGDVLKSKKYLTSDKQYPESKMKDSTKGQEETNYSELSEARVLEIIEPKEEIYSRKDSVDISLIENDGDKSSELKCAKDLTDTDFSKFTTGTKVSTLHESAAADALDEMYQATGGNLPKSPTVMSEETNVNFSPSELPPLRSYTESIIMSKKGDSFEIHSPPMISPRSKVKDLEIKPLNWMIGDEKIEISESLQPFQEFNKELEEYHSTIGQVLDTAPQNNEEICFEPEQQIDIQDEDAPKDLNMSQNFKSKFTVTKVTDQELETQITQDKYQEIIHTSEKEQEELQEHFADELSNERINKAFKDQEHTETCFQDDSTNEIKEINSKKASETNTKGESIHEEHKKVTDKEDKPIHDPSALKIKKEDLQNVNLTSKYAITVLDQVVKKEIDEVKESLQAAKQDLIEELSENNEVVFNIKDSPSEFQFKIQPETIPNELPFLYRASSSEKGSDHDSTPMSGSPVVKHKWKSTKDKEDNSETSTVDTKDISLRSDESICDCSKENQITGTVTNVDQIECQQSIQNLKDASFDESYSSSPIPASRSISDTDNKDDSFSLQPPQPAPRKRLKPSRPKKTITENEPESSGESNYQSCDYEIGSGSRPSSSEFDTMQSAFSGTLSEYETAMMSMEHSRPTSQDYQTAANTLSSRESMKSLNSLSSGHLGSVDSTSELSETLVPSETDMDEKDVMDVNLEIALDDDQVTTVPPKITMETIDSDIPCRMKRSSEMIFPQSSKDSSVEDHSCKDVIENIVDSEKTKLELKSSKNPESSQCQLTDLNSKQELENIIDNSLKSKLNEEMQSEAERVIEVQSDLSTSTIETKLGIIKSVDIITTRVNQEGIQSVSTQIISRESESVDSQEDQANSFEPDSLDQRSSFIDPDEKNDDLQVSTRTWLQQASMSTSSTSGMSIETVIEKDDHGRNSPDSDSFELVDKPDIMDDFVVIEEVGKEAKEFDSEGKSIKIGSFHCTSIKNYDRDVENLITEKKDEKEVSTSQISRNNELFEFESEESPPQASNDEQYSQSYSDEEQDEGRKKWIEMQFQSDARLYDIEYERGPLEDIKEEEITDFEAGSSKFGSMGSHKESVGSVGSIRGSFGSTPDYDTIIGKKYFIKPTDHDNVSLSSLQEFEHLENAVALENSKKFSSGSQDSGSNGSLPRRYTSRSGHGDDISLSSLKDFEGLEKACKEAHLIELRAKEEEDLLDHESPENKFKLESLTKAKTHISAHGSGNQSTSGSDDYEKRIKEIDEIIRIAQANVEKLERQDDTTEDISQIEVEKGVTEADIPTTIQQTQGTNIMETSTDSLEIEDNSEIKQNLMCRSSDSLELKTTLDLPSLSSDSLNNLRDPKDIITEIGESYHIARRISSDSLEIPERELQESEKFLQESETSSNRSEEYAADVSSRLLSYTTNNDKTNSSSGGGT
ncbi:ankyrin-2-like isoform X2 [Leptopilina boulardi]|uniref:ankyrin-2-like isoform X2 n=1 Tax=Leptopilina boulardi TaxID=63433 RepID=UPI0021F610CA|nr:ankyrin-2-like isoform X2 [Leptopilina boulardi]